MPEGPSLVILKEAAKVFEGRVLKHAGGYLPIDHSRLINRRVKVVASHGKHFLLGFSDCYLRVHLLLFGSYRLNEHRPLNPALTLTFTNGFLNFYACKARIFEGQVKDAYDWTTDVMHAQFNLNNALKKIREGGARNVCDVLLDQSIFAGSGNIIKNEVLFRVRIHPRSVSTKIPAVQLRKMVKETIAYSHQFYEWKLAGELKRHWLAYKKSVCPRCSLPLRKAHIGKGARLTFYCDNCQVKYR